MLINMKALLKVAQDNQFGVGAFNIASAEFARLVIEVAESLQSPVILEVHPDEHAFVGGSFIAYLRELAVNASVPVVIHQDHGQTLAHILTAIRTGYTSVMIDASGLPFEENIALTREITAIAHQVNVSVEAELGTIGVAEGSAEGGHSEILYTDPDQAERFARETGVDTLAVAIGTSHGLYPAGKQPVLDIDRLKAIRQRLTIPLVLHGGSGNKDSEVAESIKYGVGKINISSDMKKAFYVALQEELQSNGHEPSALYVRPMAAAKAVVEHKMRLFSSAGKAGLY
ncbi:D-tagatose-1,6-bisphosphate aldolase subunit GatY [Pantoea ananatis]|uniref:ketose-bisphosphate aldolase n=1 Tax=Pantoea ananas TaxID=553 RepID=UPI0021F6CFE6|nr:ketose-bisphosphate aldolase [Pantoea ananatis]MCW0316725.1 D-tagatose-1,6-bisphosphate aldolase subunit GatY [Pantoea ananatis]MCW0335074.1 D-tagatose-1,6-bisphosphate aldolase subunit GatY [Pantoea ananatis]MCW0384789.1 D-tagatose-1,6-bisphosphate aldolase subunit GatY [Pantoea ananatis]MCW0409432.1 D-tagatose-1,6-bisphosphate aldolase subunit GatY [Pantoea ananatis]MCW0429657.1 D-tagatose-1,6-bisphosphate aldolase subunit GatY [Pantoea ananatis]